ncbi:MAG: stage II sporulation protein R, partial [Oscillospiraceae bacterium]|nr:stage II sporulation protein R [Oscillospiraceae bacterium]
MEQKRIDRINELAKKARTVGLTEEEIAERDRLRKEYVEAVRKNLRGQLDKIEHAAADVLRREGSDYSVSVTLTKEAYPTREYENYTLPAGTYTSLHVLIGEAEGHNWWCVLFPQLCIGVQDAPDVTVIAEPDALI